MESLMPSLSQRMSSRPGRSSPHEGGHFAWPSHAVLSCTKPFKGKILFKRLPHDLPPLPFCWAQRPVSSRKDLPSPSQTQTSSLSEGGSCNITNYEEPWFPQCGAWGARAPWGELAINIIHNNNSFSVCCHSRATGSIGERQSAGAKGCLVKTG